MELIRNHSRRKLQQTAPPGSGMQADDRSADSGDDGQGTRWRRLPTFGRIAVGVEVFIGIGALAGGSLLILAPDGHLMGMPVTVLANSPFSTFLVPGLILFAVIGIGSVAGAILSYGRPVVAPLAAGVVGVILMGWVTVEMVMLAGPSSLLWALYLVLGTGLASLGLRSSRRVAT